MHKNGSIYSSLLRLVLILALGAQLLPTPVQAAIPVRVKVVAPYGSAPGAVTGLTVVHNFSSHEEKGTLHLSWISPRDGGGNPVFSYMVKYATFSVESRNGDPETWWSDPQVSTIIDGTVPAVWGIAAGEAPGAQVARVLSGLIPGATYYFATRARDRYFRLGGFDSQITMHAQAAAYAPTEPWTPHLITQLASETRVQRDNVMLSWIAPPFIDTAGNQVRGRIQHPGEYCIQYATSHVLNNGLEINDPGLINHPDAANNWAGSTRIYFATESVTTGDMQKYLLSSLDSSKTYYIHVFTRNEWPNHWSHASVANIAYPYNPIQPVESLTGTNDASTDDALASYVRLVWRNPENPGFAGVRVCMSSSGIPDSPQWPEYVDIATTLPKGTVEHTDVRLLPGSTRQYTLYAYDTEGNYSTGVSVTVPIIKDLLAPDPASSVIGIVEAEGLSDGKTAYRARLCWTNPASMPEYRNADFAGTAVYVSSASNGVRTLLGQIAGTNSSSREYVHEGLMPYTSYYYSLASYDLRGNQSVHMAQTSVIVGRNVVTPDRPVVVSAIAGADTDPAIGCSVYLKWIAPSSADLERVRIIMRTDRTPISDTDGTSVYYENAEAGRAYENTFNQLDPRTHYYFALFAYSSSGLPSTPARVSLYTAVPWEDDLAPFMPLGIRLVTSGRIVHLFWKPVKYNKDGTAFLSGSAPRTNELFGYRILRATTPFASNWDLVGTVRGQAGTFKDIPPSEGPYFYKVRSYDISDNYSDSYIIDLTGDVIVLSPSVSYIWLPEGVLGDSDYVDVAEHTAEDNGPVIKSVEWNTFTVVETATNLTLNRQIQRTIAPKKFAASSGTDKYEIGISYGSRQATAALAQIGPESMNKLSIFYNNGMEWLKLRSTLDTTNRMVKSLVKFSGKYQLRVSAPATEFSFYGIMPRIVTPNGDGQNDRVFFRYANPKVSTIRVRIFDLSGALVRKMADSDASSDIHGEYIAWDCLDDAGAIVLPGVYVYQLEGEGKVINGTIVVAR